MGAGAAWAAPPAATDGTCPGAPVRIQKPNGQLAPSASRRMFSLNSLNGFSRKPCDAR